MSMYNCLYEYQTVDVNRIKFLIQIVQINKEIEHHKHINNRYINIMLFFTNLKSLIKIHTIYTIPLHPIYLNKFK